MQVGKRIGILGGTFDPLHIGHLIIAQDAVEQFSLDQVLFVPAWQAPLKAAPPVASPEQRLAMVRAAIAGDDRFAISEVDFQHRGLSYSVDTVQRLRARHPVDALFWILGADQLAQLRHWREIETLGSLAEFIAFEREGFGGGEPLLPATVKVHVARRRALDFSSTEIRRRLQLGLPANYFLPASVLGYIKAENLYRPQTHL